MDARVVKNYRLTLGAFAPIIDLSTNGDFAMIDQATADFFIDRACDLFGDDFSDEQLEALLAEEWEGLEAMGCHTLDAACLPE